MGRAIFLVLLQALLARAQFTIIINSPPQVSTPSNQLASGDCCLSSETPPQCSSCPNLVLRLCLRVDRADTSNMNINTNCLGLGPQTLRLRGLNIYSVTIDTNTRYTGAYQLLFQVTSDVNGESLVDSGLVRVEQPLVDQSTGQFQQHQFTGSRGLATLTLTVMVTCSNLFPSCPTDSSCVPRDDLFGHYTCGSGGEVMCLPGYQDPATFCAEESQPTTGGGPMTTPTEVTEPRTMPIVPTEALETTTAVVESTTSFTTPRLSIAPSTTPTTSIELTTTLTEDTRLPTTSIKGVPEATPTTSVELATTLTEDTRLPTTSIKGVPEATPTSVVPDETQYLELLVGVGAAVGVTAALLLVLICCVTTGLLWKYCHKKPGKPDEIHTDPNPGYSEGEAIQMEANPGYASTHIYDNYQYGMFYLPPGQKLYIDEEIPTMPNIGYQHQELFVSTQSISNSTTTHS